VRTDFLFAMPSGLSGAARSLDLAGQFDEYNESPNEAAADAKALFCDWRTVGESLVQAMKAIRRELQAQGQQIK
jgi:hypothetical protein